MGLKFLLGGRKAHYKVIRQLRIKTNLRDHQDKGGSVEEYSSSVTYSGRE